MYGRKKEEEKDGEEQVTEIYKEEYPIERKRGRH
jgi:hypothetical protein